jgi:hypothetical protein
LGNYEDLNSFMRNILTVKCPNCGAEVGASSKEWKYGIFHAKRYDSPIVKYGSENTITRIN